MVHLDSNRISRVPSYSGNPLEFISISSTGLLPSMVGFSKPFLYTDFISLLRPLQPRTPKCTVWAIPRSLAATDGISFDFFSYRYLDVSVPCVRFLNLCIQSKMTEHHPCRVPPFGNPGVKSYLRLVQAYRSLSRPSSLSGAKASALHLHSPHQKSNRKM